ncbi:hypothetical protein ACIQZG_18660 [Lysinibacillus sp. NPDC096418]|uniref:hypothetical protein n=1 Tax=Lysinibacillus sp. NPDC096418 TaxID=3364138 RepID=UPI00382CC1C3
MTATKEGTVSIYLEIAKKFLAKIVQRCDFDKSIQRTRKECVKTILSSKEGEY